MNMNDKIEKAIRVHMRSFKIEDYELDMLLYCIRFTALNMPLEEDKNELMNFYDKMLSHFME